MVRTTFEKNGEYKMINVEKLYTIKLTEQQAQEAIRLIRKYKEPVYHYVED